MAQKSYSLEQCKQLAISNNSIVKDAKLDVQAAKQVKASALTKYFPSVSASMNGFLADKPLLKMSIPGGNLPVYNGNPATLPTATQFAYFPGINLNYFDKGMLSTVTLTQPVFTGGRIINGNKLASVGISANRSKEKLAVNEVLLHTEEAFWQVNTLGEKMKTLNRYSCFLDSLYKQANDAYHAGLINRNEVMKVMLKQSELSMNRLKLEHGITLSKMALCQYIGIPYDSALVFTQNIDSIVLPEHFYVNPQQALANREEYKLLQDNVKAQKLQTQIKVGSYLPEIGVGVSEAYYNFSTMKDFNTLAFVSVKVPLTDWWEASHAIKERHIKEQIAANDLENNSELLTLQIQKAWDELVEAYSQIGVAKVTVQQAEENLRLNQDNFHAGMINISDMLEAEAMLQQSQNELIDAKTAYKTKQIAYLQAVGKN
nr:TolC family protein [Microbacter margulisiae]